MMVQKLCLLRTLPKVGLWDVQTRKGQAHTSMEFQALLFSLPSALNDPLSNFYPVRYFGSKEY